MKLEIKLQIVAAMETYLAAHKISQHELAKHSGVNVAYISTMIKRTFETGAGKGKVVTIAPKYFIKIADHIGYSIEKNYWPTVSTEHTVHILSVLEDALNYGYFNLIIGVTGCGKTFVSKLFAKKHPIDIIHVTVSSADNLTGLLDKIREGLGIPLSKVRDKRLRDIVQHLKKMKEAGRKMMIVFDESEFMKLPTLCMMKELHDWLHKICALVMLGTPELLDNLEKLRNRNTPGIPQFCRRIKFGIRMLPGIDTTFKPFLMGYDAAFRNFISDICDNYGELHDVLVPALREAERTGEPINENFIRKILGLPPKSSKK